MQNRAEGEIAKTEEGERIMSIGQTLSITHNDLKICHSLVREAIDVHERMERLRAMAERCTTQPAGFGGYGSGVNDRVGNTAAMLADMQRKADECVAAYMGHAECVALAIDSIEDSTQRTVLRMRYLDGLSWEDISEKTHYSERWLRKLHGRGLSSLLAKEDL